MELTRREHEILHLLETRRTNQEIADILSISVRTVECHVRGILAKLGAPNRRAAVALNQDQFWPDAAATGARHP